MILDRYYYMSLTKNNKLAYRKIYSAISAFLPTVTIYDIKEKEIHKIIEGIVLDNPHLFYFDLRKYSYYVSTSAFTLSLSYLCNDYEMKKIKSNINVQVQGILSSLELISMSDYEKEKYIHDYLCRNIKYDDICSKNDNINIEAHTIWGVFLEKRAVCDGISKAFKYLCNALDIKRIVVIGHTNKECIEFHAWNIVKIYGQAYQADVTWDLNKREGNSYTYY